MRFVKHASAALIASFTGASVRGFRGGSRHGNHAESTLAIDANPPAAL